MSFMAFTLSAVLAQAGTEAAVSSSPTDRAVEAAERAAAAAEKAALAAERIANRVAPPEADKPAAAPAPAAAWAGSVGVGATFITGNAQTLTLTANVQADRKWEKWSLGIRASGAYGTANPTNIGTGSVVARRAGASIRGDHNFSSVVSLFLLGGSEFDHMKNIESRTAGEFGTGLTFFNLKEGDLEKLFLRLDLAARVGYETRFQYFGSYVGIVDPYGAIILAPRAGLQMRWGVSKDVKVSEEIEFVPYLLAAGSQPAGRLLINNTTKLSARLTEMFALTTAVVINYDSAPPQPKDGTRVNTDVALTVGIDAIF